MFMTKMVHFQVHIFFLNEQNFWPGLGPIDVWFKLMLQNGSAFDEPK